MNHQENKEIYLKNGKNYCLNMNILDSIKATPNKIIPFDNNEFIDEDISQKYTYSNITTNSPYSILNPNFQNFSELNNFRQNPNYKAIGLEYTPFNFLYSFNKSYPFYIYPRNFYLSLYNNNIINYSFLDLKKEHSQINNAFSQFNKNYEDINVFGINCFSKNNFLKKKRITYDNISLNLKNDNFNNINIKKEHSKKNEIKRKKYICNHKGCQSNFKTKKLAIFHHMKMSTECHEDSISILKLIYETKKILLKNKKNSQQSLNKYSSLYENTMANISQKEYIKIFVGFKINDNL